MTIETVISRTLQGSKFTWRKGLCRELGEVGLSDKTRAVNIGILLIYSGYEWLQLRLTLILRLVLRPDMMHFGVGILIELCMVVLARLENSMIASHLHFLCTAKPRVDHPHYPSNEDCEDEAGNSRRTTLLFPPKDG